MKALRFIVGLLIVALIPGFTYAFFYLFTQTNLAHTPIIYFLIGITLAIFLWSLLGRKLRFLNTFLHELSHLMIGLFFLKIPSKFLATEDDGGVVEMYGNNFLIALAPYFCPVLCLLCLPLFFIVREDYLPLYFAVLGLLAGYHILLSIKDFSFVQSDIDKHGKVFSLTFVVFMGIINYGVILGLVVDGFFGIADFFQNGIMTTVTIFGLM